jgi:hypothetical protein
MRRHANTRTPTRPRVYSRRKRRARRKLCSTRQPRQTPLPTCSPLVVWVPQVVGPLPHRRHLGVRQIALAPQTKRLDERLQLRPELGVSAGGGCGRAWLMRERNSVELARAGKLVCERTVRLGELCSIMRAPQRHARSRKHHHHVASLSTRPHCTRTHLVRARAGERLEALGVGFGKVLRVSAERGGQQGSVRGKSSR